MPQRHEIYLVRVPLRASFDYRPCIVLDVSHNTIVVGVMLVSSSSLYRKAYDFLIPKEHPNFAATGLKKTSFAIGDQIRDVAAADLNQYLGRLEGELAREFDKWIS